ncbi:hypothetical protein C8R44DRAFT_990315 [Mycena epipterygia]|nr:hypothetical protein C8R44DRAFT_990315 [Mycena epipterygia]
MATLVAFSRPDSKAFPLLLLKKLVMSKFAASVRGGEVAGAPGIRVLSSDLGEPPLLRQYSKVVCSLWAPLQWMKKPPSHALQFSLSSFIDDADGEPDVDLDDHSGFSAVAGPSSTLHPRLRLIQFTLTEKPATRFTAKEHQLVQRNVEAVGHGQTILDDRISKVQHDLTAGFEGIDARLVGMAADLAEAANGGNPLTTSTLITASNKHTANSTAMGTAINDAYVRIRQVEEIAGSITSLTATVAQLGTTFQAVLRQLCASSGTAPSAMSGDDAALINDALNPNGKRAHEEDDASVKRQHLDTGVTLPDSFVLLAPSSLLRCSLLPPSCHPPSSSCPPLRPPPSRPLLPRPTLHRPTSHPLRLVRSLVLPLGNYHHFPRNLISNVLTKTIRSVRYTSRRGSDDATAILIFDADTVAATWFIHVWNNAARSGDVAAPSLRTFLSPPSPKWIESDPLPRPALFTFV